MVQIKTQNLFINHRNYTFSKFDKEIGHSGHLIIAVNKKNPQSKWIVKHEVVSDIFAEFFYSSISNDLGFSVPECRLGEYKGKLAVYIKYIENLKRIPRADYCDEIYKRMFLMNLFGNDDREEFYADDKNKIWQLDNSWCFYDEDFIKLIYHKDSLNFDTAQLIEQGKQNRFRYAKDSDFNGAYLSINERTDNKEIAKEVFQGVSKLDIEKYKTICDEIALVATDEIAKAYYEYILEIIQFVKEKIDNG